MTKKELKIKILKTGVFEENEYLNKYIDLIYNNLNNKKIKYITHLHHIIPKYYFKFKCKQVDNSKNNQVNLTLKQHIEAHYYLEKCSIKSFKGKNIFSIYKLTGTELTKDELEHLLQNDSEIDLIDFKNIYFTEGHKKSLKEAAKNRKSINGHISEKGYVGGVTGLKAIHTPEGKRTYVEEDLIPFLLTEGYSLKGDTFKKPKGFNKSESFRKEQSKRLNNYYKKNPNFETKSKKQIRIFNEKQEIIFKTVTEAEIALGIKEKNRGKGFISAFVKKGYITRKNCIYNRWKIEYLKNEKEVMPNEKVDSN